MNKKFSKWEEKPQTKKTPEKQKNITKIVLTQQERLIQLFEYHLCF